MEIFMKHAKVRQEDAKLVTRKVTTVNNAETPAPPALLTSCAAPRLLLFSRASFQEEQKAWSKQLRVCT